MTLRSMIIDGKLNVVTAIMKAMSVVLTQYEAFGGETIDDIHHRLTRDCSPSYLGYIKYDFTAEDWKDKLKEKIIYAINSNH